MPYTSASAKGNLKVVKKPLEIPYFAILAILLIPAGLILLKSKGGKA